MEYTPLEHVGRIYVLSMGGVVYTAMLGFLWMPAAAVICAWRARSRGLPIFSYALFGALCSVLFIIPWIFLMARMYDKNIPKIVVKIVYIALYGIWLIGPVSILSVATISIVVFWIENVFTQRYNFYGMYLIILAVAVVVMLLSITTWIFSLIRLRVREKWIGSEQITLTPHDPVHDSVYLAPWAFLFVWMPVGFGGAGLMIGAFLMAGHA